MKRLDIARLFLHVREAGANSGQRVNAIQEWSGGADGLGLSWCCFWVTMVLDLEFGGASPIPRLGACQDVLDLADRNGWTVVAPDVGDLVISVRPDGHAHHIAIVTALDPLTAIAGNTDETGTSSNGDRVAEHPISPAAKVFVRVPVTGG